MNETEEIKARAFAQGFRVALEAILNMLKDGDDWEEPEINPCRGCDDYDGRGGCKSHGGCGAERSEDENY